MSDLSRIVLTLCSAFLSFVAQGQPTAVINTEHASWYDSAKFDPDRTGELPPFEMTDGFAPLPVFFEGGDSTPHAEIDEWRWDFGDGSDTFSGFNAAHVFEHPGRYEVSLRVTTDDGATWSAPATTMVNVYARNGTTYYIDSTERSPGVPMGDDSNMGNDPDAPWLTAQRAFDGMSKFRYKPGDQVLFRRGGTYEIREQVTINHGRSGWGYMIGAYGVGPKPKLVFTGDKSTTFLMGQGKGAARITIRDLDIQCENWDAIDERSKRYCRITNFWEVRENAHNLLLYNLDVRNPGRLTNFNGKSSEDAYNISNVFVIGCTTTNTTSVTIGTFARRVAIVDCHFDKSENHIHYGNWIETGLISGNIYTRPPRGKHAFRISSASDSFDRPSSNIYIADNYFGGQRDLLDGTFMRQPWLIVDLAPNRKYVNNKRDDGLALQKIEDIIFERNVVANGLRLMRIAAHEDSIIRNNLMITPNNEDDHARITFGDHFENRAIDTIEFSGNTIYSNERRKNGRSLAGFLRIHPFWLDDGNQHQNITIAGNKFYTLGNAETPYYWYDYRAHPTFETDGAAGESAVNAINETATITTNTYFKNGATKNHGYTGGLYNSTRIADSSEYPAIDGTLRDHATWHGAYATDEPPSAPKRFKQRPYPGQAYSPPAMGWGEDAYVLKRPDLDCTDSENTEERVVASDGDIPIYYDLALYHDPRNDHDLKAVSTVTLWVKVNDEHWAAHETTSTPDRDGTGEFRYSPQSPGTYHFMTSTNDGTLDSLKPTDWALAKLLFASTRTIVSPSGMAADLPSVVAFEVPKSSDPTIKIFDDGTIAYSGELRAFQSLQGSHSDDDHVVKDADGTIVAILSRSGDILLKGGIREGQRTGTLDASALSDDTNHFRIKDSSGRTVVIISTSEVTMSDGLKVPAGTLWLTKQAIRVGNF